MDVQQVLHELKKEYMNIAGLVDVTQVEKIIVQMKNAAATNNGKIGESLSEVENAKRKILDLSEELRSIDATNTNLSQNIIVLEERFISLQRDNWKYKEECERNRGKVEVYMVENKCLIRDLLEQEGNNGKLKKQLGDLNEEFEIISVFIDKIVESHKKLWKALGGVPDEQRKIENVQKSVLNKEKYETALKDLGVLTEYYRNKRKIIENEKVLVVTELEKFKVEYDILENSVDNDFSEASDLLARMFTIQFKQNYDFFRKNVDDQESRLKRLTELLEEESAINSRLKLLLNSKKGENEEHQDSMVELATHVKNEISLIENADSDNVI